MFDFYYLSIIFVVSMGAVGFLYGFYKNMDRRYFILFPSISILIYSGIGIALEYVEKSYIVKYFVFLYTFLITMFLLYTIKDCKRNYASISFYDISIRKNIKIYKVASLIFILLGFVYLIVPEFRLIEFILPKPPTISGIFEKRDIVKSNSITYIVDTIRLLLMPFFFIFLQYLKENKKYKKITIYLFMFIYLDYLKSNYIGRHEMIGYALLIFFVYFQKDNLKKFKVKQIVAIICLFLFSIPMLLNYEKIRLGANVNQDTNYVESSLELIEKETNYPKWYPDTEIVSEFVTPQEYYKWIVFLPIPSKLIPFKPNLSINEVFSSYVTGVTKDEKKFNILLPSILGESFIIYNHNLYWVHAIFLGIFICLISILTEKHKMLRLWSIFLVIESIKIGRGGSQGFIGTVVNSNVLLICLMLKLKFEQKKGKYKIVISKKNRKG